jgi:hypothetical protein
MSSDFENMLQELYDTGDCEPYERGYSGRGMYGKECYAVRCDNLSRGLYACGAVGLPIPQTDSLGRSYVLYWPSMPLNDVSGKGVNP